MGLLDARGLPLVSKQARGFLVKLVPLQHPLRSVPPELGRSIVLAFIILHLPASLTLVCRTSLCSLAIPWA